MKSNKILYREFIENEIEERFIKTFSENYVYLQIAQSVIPTIKGWIKRELANGILLNADIEKTANEEIESWWNKQKIEKNKMEESDINKFLAARNLTVDILKEMSMINAKCKLWSVEQWQSSLPQLFLDKKDYYDQVKFKIVRIPKSEGKLANELYHRIKAKENNFEEIALTFGHGAEKMKDGCIKKMRLDSGNPQLVEKLRNKNNGDLISPFRLNEWYIIIEIIDSYSAQLDDTIQAKPIDEAFGSFLRYTTNKFSNLSSKNTPDNEKHRQRNTVKALRRNRPFDKLSEAGYD